MQPKDKRPSVRYLSDWQKDRCLIRALSYVTSSDKSVTSQSTVHVISLAHEFVTSSSAHLSAFTGGSGFDRGSDFSWGSRFSRRFVPGQREFFWS